jgi:DNA-binding CsgD family transcriptional regulator
MDVTSKLGELTMPVLVLHRREAFVPSIDLIRALVASIPKARLMILEGSSLMPFLGDSDEVLRAVEPFLAEPSEARPAGLTEREIEILALLAGGSSNERIARALSVSTRTVERHIGNIYLKIGAHNRAEATAYAFRHGIASVS